MLQLSAMKPLVATATAAILAFTLAGLFALRLSAAPEPRFIPDLDYTHDPRGPKLDLYLPVVPEAAAPSGASAGPSAPASPAPATPAPALHPALLWIHGNNQNKLTPRASIFCDTLAGQGYVCASIDYTPVVPDSHDAIRDCKNAVRFLRANAATYDIDPQRIGVVGLSMGGFLALMTAFTDGVREFEPRSPYPGVSSSVRSVIDFFGVTRQRDIDTVDFIRRNSPPVLLIHGTADGTVPYEVSVRLDAALAAKGVKRRLVPVRGFGHGFNLEDLSPVDHQPIDLRPLVFAFLRQTLAPLPAK